MDFTGFIVDILNQVGAVVTQVLNTILSVLPDSPFTIISQNSDVAQVMGYVNYFVPIDFFISVMTPWAIAVSVYFIYAIVLRWIKAIE